MSNLISGKMRDLFATLIYSDNPDTLYRLRLQYKNDELFYRLYDGTLFKVEVCKSRDYKGETKEWFLLYLNDKYVGWSTKYWDVFNITGNLSAFTFGELSVIIEDAKSSK